MPTVVKNWLDKLISTHPSKSAFNLIGKLMGQVNDYRVISTDSIDAIGMWLLKDRKNIDIAISYIASKEV